MAEEKKTESKVRRTELPVYSDEPKKAPEKPAEVNNAIVISAIQTFRSEGCKLARAYKSVTERCRRFVDTGVAHAHSNYVTTIDYLHEKNNILPRIGVISGGALFGYVIGLRKGFFKRLLYTSSGGIITGSICYPKEAEEYFYASVHSSKKYLAVGYHFLNGVSKDYVGFELPTLPSRIVSQDAPDTPKKEN